MRAADLQPGDKVEVVLVLTVSKAEWYPTAGTSGHGAQPYTNIEFDEFPLAVPLASGRTTSAYTLELPDNSDHTITRLN